MDASRLAHWRRWEAYVLDTKGVTDLERAITDEATVARVATDAARGSSTAELLDRFFASHPDLLAMVVAVADEEPINHVGFQTEVPMDVWVDLAYRGAADSMPGFELDLVGVKRFTASAAFQQRVGAFVEMAQVWHRVDGDVVELELFDIHRPFRFERRRDSHQIGTLLADDDIWHYGVRIDRAASVRELHRAFTELIAADPGFTLRTPDTVTNRWHGSTHTKLTNLTLDIEIEFLSYRLDEEET